MLRRAATDILTVVAVLVVIALAVGQLTGQPILFGYVTSESMSPTLETGDGTGDDDGASAGDDGDPDAGAGPGELIELAGFGVPISLGVVGAVVTLLTLSYAYRLRVAASIAGNLDGPGQ